MLAMRSADHGRQAGKTSAYLAMRFIDDAIWIMDIKSLTIAPFHHSWLPRHQSLMTREEGEGRDVSLSTYNTRLVFQSHHLCHSCCDGTTAEDVRVYWDISRYDRLGSFAIPACLISKANFLSPEQCTPI